MDRSATVGAEWAITILFYAAVHHVQAYFTKKSRTYTQHLKRASAIHKDKNLSLVYVDYRELETHSRDARYDFPGYTDAEFQNLIPKFEKIKQCVQSLI